MKQTEPNIWLPTEMNLSEYKILSKSEKVTINITTIVTRFLFELRLFRPGFLILFTGIFISVCSAGQETTPKVSPSAAKRVLLLSPFNISFAQYHQTVTGFMEGLSYSGESYWLTQLEVDSLSPRNHKEHEKTQLDTILPAIRNGEYDLIVTFGEQALSLLAEHIDSLPPEVSIIFCNQDNADLSRFASHTNITGLIQQNALSTNIKLIRQLFPEKNKIVLLTNWMPAGKRIQAAANEFIRQTPDIELNHIDNETVSSDEMLNQIAKLDNNSVILFHGWFNHCAINFASLRQLLTALSKNPNVPLFVMHSTMLQDGVVGGSVEQGRSSGIATAAIAARILRGEAAGTIPIQTLDAELVLNWKMIQDYQIPDSVIPTDVTILGKPDNFWISHREWLSGGFVAFSVIFLLYILSSCFYFVRNRRKFKVNLDIFNGLPVRIGVITPAEKVLYISFNDGVDPGKIKPKTLFEIPNIDYPKISAAFKEVFTNGIPVTIDYEQGDVKRSLRIALLPNSAFKCRAAVWISHDNGALQEIRTQAESLTRENQNYIREMSNANKLWDTVINAMPVFFFAKDVENDFRYVLANDSFAAFVNRRHEDIIGKTDAEIFPDSAEAAHFRQYDIDSIAMSNNNEFIERVRGDGENIRVLRTKKQVFTTIDDRRVLLGTSIDISREFNLLESEQIVKRVLQQAVLESDFDKVIGMVADEIMNITGGDLLTISRYEEAQSSYTNICERHIDMNLFDLAKLDLFYRHVTSTFKQGKMVVLSNISDSEFAPFFPVVNVRSFIGAPITVNEVFWGAIFLGFSHDRRSFSDTDEGCLRSMTNIIALAQIRKLNMDAIEHASMENQLILNNVKIPIRLFGADRKTLRVNTAFCEISGKNESDILNNQDCTVFYPQKSEQQTSSVLLDMVLRNGHSAKHETHLNNRDYIVYAEPVTDKNGHLINVIESAIDITEQNRMTENERFLSRCLEMVMPDENAAISFQQILQKVCKYMNATRTYILRYDFENNMIYSAYEYCADKIEPFFSIMNPTPISRSEKWLERLMEKKISCAPDLADEETFSEKGIWQSAIRKLAIKSLYTAGIFREGKLWGTFSVSFEAEKYVLPEPDIALLKSLGNIMEIMLLRQTHIAMLSQALQKAELADKAKSTFWTTISHELRTPLNAVIGFSEIIAAGGNSEKEMLSYVKNINLAGKALLNLINDVLDLSKIEAEQIKIVPSPTDIQTLFDELKAVFSAAAHSNNIFLKFNITPDFPWITLDELRLRQILLNLIGNALKFTINGGVTVSAVLDGEIFEVRVADTGMGIAPEFQTEIFEPFIQQDAIRDSKVFKGTGLGLAISKKLAERMNGTLKVQSALNEGSTFTLQINNVKTTEKPTESDAKAEISLTGKWRILLVDDVPLNLMVLSAMLGKLGLKVTQANSGNEALIKMQECPVDLVLTDMWMPEMDGKELARIIHSSPEFANVKVIVISADTEVVGGEEAKYFDGKLLKPVTITGLKKLLSEFQAG